MTMQEIVIKIPEEMWERVKDGYVPLGISKYLKNGTVLSKGHGKLIDADALEDYIKEDADEWDKYALAYVEDAPTIIEADTESEVEE